MVIVTNTAIMKLLMLVCAIAYATGAAIPPGGEKDAKIIRQDLDLSPEGAYQFGFETDNGISQEARGEINTNAETPVLISQGQSSYTSPEGVAILLTYIADETGYHPQGDHLPTPPPIPEAILRALEYIRSHPPAADN